MPPRCSLISCAGFMGSMPIGDQLFFGPLRRRPAPDGLSNEAARARSRVRCQLRYQLGGRGALWNKTTARRHGARALRAARRPGWRGRASHRERFLLLLFVVVSTLSSTLLQDRLVRECLIEDIAQPVFSAKHQLQAQCSEAVDQMKAAVQRGTECLASPATCSCKLGSWTPTSPARPGPAGCRATRAADRAGQSS